jgi:hypothetical protein
MSGELSPGSTPRRWLPEEGEKNLRERIHRESVLTDKYKNLPFKFSKPPRNKPSNIFKCSMCDHLFFAPKNTIMVICSNCKKLTKVEKIVGKEVLDGMACVDNNPE